MILGHVVTVHKSQGGTLNYMKVDLSWSTGKETAIGKTCQQTISQGQFYIVLWCAKSHGKVLLLHFHLEQIKANESALGKMVRIKEE